MNGAQSGLESVFTPAFGLVWFVALLFGAGFAWVCRHARKLGFLPRQPMNTVTFVIVGVAMTGFLAGFIIGWNETVMLALVFLASGVPQMVESIVSNLEWEKDKIRAAVKDVN